MDLGETSIELVMTDSIQEKFRKLDVEAALQVSILSGLVKLGGSGSYLSEEKTGARAQCMSLLYKYKSVSEEIIIRQHRNKIDLDVLTPSEGHNLNGTHVAVGIDWGANCTITCEYETKEDEDMTKVKGKLKLEIEKLEGLVDVKGKASVDVGNRSKDNHMSFIFKCKSDVSATDKDLPTTFDGAVHLVKSLPSMVKSTNQGRGVPLTYMLMPLEVVSKICKLQLMIEPLYRSITDDTIQKTVHFMDRVVEKRQVISDIHKDLHNRKDFLAVDTLVKVDGLRSKFTEQESSFKTKLQQLVNKVRSAEEDVSSLENLISRESDEMFADSQFHGDINSFQTDLNNVRTIESWIKRGIIYIGKKENLLSTDDRKNVFVLYRLSSSNNETNQKNQDLFLRLQKTDSEDTTTDSKFVVVDHEIKRDIWPAGLKASTIYKYTNGTRVSKNLFDKEGRDLEMCLIKNRETTYERTLPSDRTTVKLRCPNSLSGRGECSGNVMQWKCSHCKNDMEYGISTKLFYCKCGGYSIPSKSLFRCNESEHGITYIKYPEDILHAELSHLRAMKEKNILILGETGVGKSTWINGFANYLMFNDIEEAISSKEFVALIPSMFTFTKEGNPMQILVGEGDTNESSEIGVSATQDPRSYVFHIDDERVRLIDTPGIGDSRGLEQDKTNFDNILAYLTNYKEIHAVCILLKPNNARLTTLFRFCIQELLAHLHASAKSNIVFCFTNARATMYEPGDSLPALNKLLQDRNVGIEATPHNYFCFDNESFRFLACRKNGVMFNQDDVDTYAKSWDRSVKETIRLFDHISTLNPHKISDTVNMNEARRIIVEMSKPLAQVAMVIQENKHEGEEFKSQVKQCEKEMTGMKEVLSFKGHDLKRTSLDQPRTVCTHSKCIEYEKFGKDRVENIIYSTICHSPCTLPGIRTETTNDYRLYNCRAFWGGIKGQWGGPCIKCGHSFREHMHITYEIKKIPKEFLSKEVQGQLEKMTSGKTQKEEALNVIEEKIKQLNVEEAKIMKTSAKYGSFLMENAMIPYNDAVGDYLDMSIKQETDKTSSIRNVQMLHNLEKMKREYKKERDMLDSAIGTGCGENITSPEEVMKLQEELFELQHMGPTLKNLFTGIRIDRTSNNMKFQEKVVTVPRKQVPRKEAQRKMSVPQRTTERSWAQKFRGFLEDFEKASHPSALVFNH